MSVENNDNEKEDEFKIDVSFLHPDFILNDNLGDFTYSFNRAEENSVEINIIYLLNWMISRALYEKSFTHDEDTDDEKLIVTIEIDSFLIDYHFEEDDLESIKSVMETVCGVFEDTFWSKASFDAECYSETEYSTHQEFRELEGDDPVVSIKLYLELDDPIIEKNMPFIERKRILNS